MGLAIGPGFFVVNPAASRSRYLAPGDKLGKYELIRQIAVGGMAELYLARTVGIEGFEKLVVIKRILPQYADNASFVGMFLNEARLAATLHHPNIAQVYDIGQEHGEYFFSMEYVHGEDLRHLGATATENGVPISLDAALTLASGLCAALHYAHDKAGPDGKPLDVVHRDVSPSNVLVSYDGAVKLVDFGIARIAGVPSSTRGGLKGKIGYMSPEQCRGKAVLDRRSDLFSIGTILYELTTGQMPFTDETEYGILNQIVNRDADPPSKLVPSYPPALEAIVMRALARDPDKRFATALELQHKLEDFAHDSRLRVSPLVLARLMSTLFPQRLEEWAHARAQGAFFVEQHVVRTLIESGKTADSGQLAAQPPPPPVAGDDELTAIAQSPDPGTEPLTLPRAAAPEEHTDVGTPAFAATAARVSQPRMATPEPPARTPTPVPGVRRSSPQMSAQEPAPRPSSPKLAPQEPAPRPSSSRTPTPEPGAMRSSSPRIATPEPAARSSAPRIPTPEPGAMRTSQPRIPTPEPGAMRTSQPRMATPPPQPQLMAHVAPPARMPTLPGTLPPTPPPAPPPAPVLFPRATAPLPGLPVEAPVEIPLASSSAPRPSLPGTLVSSTATPPHGSVVHEIGDVTEQVRVPRRTATVLTPIRRQRRAMMITLVASVAVAAAVVGYVAVTRSGGSAAASRRSTGDVAGEAKPAPSSPPVAQPDPAAPAESAAASEPQPPPPSDDSTTTVSATPSVPTVEPTDTPVEAAAAVDEPVKAKSRKTRPSKVSKTDSKRTSRSRARSRADKKPPPAPKPATVEPKPGPKDSSWNTDSPFMPVRPDSP